MSTSANPDEPRTTPTTTPSAVLRPIRADDGLQLWELLNGASGELTGMASLPTSAAEAVDRSRAAAATVEAVASDSLETGPGSAHPLLLVLEDRAGDRLLGLTGCTLKYAVANYSVEIGTDRHGQGLSLRGHRRPWTCTELNATFLHPDARGTGLGTLLSRGRMAFLTIAGNRIPVKLVSHLRGPMRGEPSAPFWQSFGVRVLPQWSTSARAEKGLATEPDRLDELADFAVPIDPAVLDVLGSVHRDSLPAFRLLQAEGLQPNGMYDPVDGGPTLTGELTATTTWDRRRWYSVQPPADQTDANGDGDGDGDGPTVDALITNGRLGRFRARRVATRLDEPAAEGVGRLRLAPDVGRDLELEAGARALVVPLAGRAQAEAGGGGVR